MGEEPLPPKKENKKSPFSEEAPHAFSLSVLQTLHAAQILNLDPAPLPLFET